MPLRVRITRSPSQFPCVALAGKSPAMKSLCLLVVGFCFLPHFAANGAKAPEPPGVELIVDGPVLQPATSLEFRFAQPMVSRDDVGLPVKEPPITIAPAVPGNFTWLSSRSGAFVAE